MEDKIRWGIIGPGKISNKFAADLALVPDAEITAVASRSMDRASTFAASHLVKTKFSSYESMISDGNIDIAYIGTPHSFHLEQTLLCLENGIAVCCEKPASLNALEVQKMVEAASANNVFFMEALWTRFIPSMKRVLKIVESGGMGAVVQIEAEFCFEAPVDPLSRLYNLSLGGGSILDIGIYPAFLAYLLLGVPQKITATAQRHDTGSDQTCTMQFEYPDGKSASLFSSVVFESQMPARITMEKGYILIQPRWHESAQLVLIKAGDEAKTIDCPALGKGFSHEIEECHRCLRSGKIESELWSHQNSLDLISILDEVRDQVGVRYPGRD